MGYLFFSVSLSVIRNFTSKKTSAAAEGKASFFLYQSILFFCATVFLSGITLMQGSLRASGATLLCAGIYAILLFLSQGMLTVALKYGNISVCSVIYSFGFILPTLSGTVFWGEPFTVWNFLGLLLVIAVILLTEKQSRQESKGNGRFLFFITVAMLCSGGLGIMQKLQQSTCAVEETPAFLTLSFLFAFIVSLILYLLCPQKEKVHLKQAGAPCITGLCFGGANFCNTLLAGQMKSAVFFPLQNVLVILLSTLVGVLLFRERITAKISISIFLSICVIVLFWKF